MDTVRRFGRVGVAFALATCSMAGYALAQIDLSGEWRPLLHEDLGHRADAMIAAGPGAGAGIGGPRIGDYTGLPINDAARLQADSWDPRIWAAPEHQLLANPGAYWVLGPGGVRISKIVEAATQRVLGLQIYRPNFGSTTRMIWMDGRPHPPAHVAHTFQGFSTGRWNGEILVVETTHLKTGWIRRNGVPASDAASLTEHIARHGSYLTIVRILNDPIYLEEPLVTSATWVLDPRQQLVEPRPTPIFDEIRGLTRAFVPHFLPGTNTHLKEFAEHMGLPFEATRGGRETAYPEYQRTIKTLIAARPKTYAP